MKYCIFIIFGLIVFSSQSTFLRNLTALTVNSVTFSSKCIPSITAAFTYEAPFTGTPVQTPNDKAITSTVTDGTTSLTFSCDKLTTTATKLSCKYASGTSANGEYKITAVVEESGGNTFTVISLADTKFKINSNYVVLKSTTASTQTVNYKNAAPYTFTITYASDLDDNKKPSKVIASATTPKEFTDCTYTKAVVTCTVTKEKLPIGEYAVKVLNVCGNEEDTGITLKAVEDESTGSSSFATVSMFMAFIGLFLF